MIIKITSTALLLVVALMPATASAKTCDKSDPKKTVCKLQVEDLRPTQFSVGSVAATCKAYKIAEKSKKKLKKYLNKEKNHIPVVIGPDGGFYMTDHHHLATGLYRAISADWGDSSKVVTVTVLDNRHNDGKTSWGEFWEVMKENNRSYNYDNKGTPDMNFALLPKDVSGLLNDPYRTLSRWVRESCGYVKKGKEQCDHIRTDHDHEAPFFMEFYWGDFFRKHLELKREDLKVCSSIPYSPTCLKDEVEQLKGIYEQAMTLAASPQAKAYFESQKPPLDPWAYGYNPSGEHLKLEWGGYRDGCEEVED